MHDDFSVEAAEVARETERRIAARRGLLRRAFQSGRFDFDPVVNLARVADGEGLLPRTGIGKAEHRLDEMRAIFKDARLRFATGHGRGAGLEHFGDHEFIARPVVPPLEQTEAADVREKLPVKQLAFPRHLLLTFQREFPPQRIGLRARGFHHHLQRGLPARGIEHEGFPQFIHVAEARDRRDPLQVRDAGPDRQPISEIRDRPRQRAATLHRHGHIHPAPLARDFVFHDDVIERIRHRQQAIDRLAQRGIHQHRPRGNPEPPEQMRREKRLVFAIAKPPPQHDAGRRGNLPAESRVQAQVADFILHESERAIRPIRGLRRGGRDLVHQFHELRLGEILHPRRVHPARDFRPRCAIRNLKPRVHDMPSRHPRLDFARTNFLQLPLPLALAIVFFENGRVFILAVFPADQPLVRVAHAEVKRADINLRGHRREKPEILRHQARRRLDRVAHVDDVAHAHILDEHAPPSCAHPPRNGRDFPPAEENANAPSPPARSSVPPRRTAIEWITTRCDAGSKSSRHCAASCTACTVFRNRATRS